MIQGSCYLKGLCMSVLLYADNILLIAPSVSSVNKLLHICEQELTLLDMAINAKSLHVYELALVSDTKSLHWLKVNERIEYKLISLAYKVLTTAQPSYLHNLISVQPPCSTHSSSVVTVSCLPTILKITDRSFRYASPHLWNQLPDSFRQPHFLI